MQRDRRQKTLEFRTWGGKRKGAGRQARAGKRPSVSHHGRDHHKASHPVHLILRLRAEIPSLRERRLYVAVEDAIRAGNARFGFRAVEFSVQKATDFAGIRDSSIRRSGLLVRSARDIPPTERAILGSRDESSFHGPSHRIVDDACAKNPATVPHATAHPVR